MIQTAIFIITIKEYNFLKIVNPIYFTFTCLYNTLYIIQIKHFLENKN